MPHATRRAAGGWLGWGQRLPPPTVLLTGWALVAFGIAAAMRSVGSSLPIFGLFAIPLPFLALVWKRTPAHAAIVILFGAGLVKVPFAAPNFDVELFRMALQCAVLAGMSEIIRAGKAQILAESKRVDEQERPHRLLLEAIDAIPWELDLATFRFTYVGPQCVELLGYPRDEWFEEGFWLDHIHPEDREESWGFCQAATRRGEDHDFEYRMIAADGRTVWIRDLVSIVGPRDEPTGLQGILLDVTREREAAAERLALETRMLEAQRRESLGLLAGGIAHDFNNLLTGVLGSASLGLEQLDDEVALREHLQAIQVAAERGADLTQQMLAYSGRGSVVTRTEDLSTIVTETSQLIRAALSKDTQLELELARTPLWIRGDAGQLHQIVLNLITNAADATGGSGCIRVRTARCSFDAATPSGIADDKLLPPGEYALVAVADEGKGIPDELLGRLTEPFFTTKPNGRGLGLSAVHGIVEGHGGGMWIDSAVGRGTEVRVLLPLSTPPAEPERSDGPRRDTRLSNARVLVADDDPDVRRIAVHALRREGAIVREAVDGTETLEALDEERFDLVVLDVVMPGRSGLEILDRIRKGPQELPVLLVSGYSDAAEGVDLRHGGDTSFLAKPFRPEHLVDRAVAVLRRFDTH